MPWELRYEPDTQTVVVITGGHISEVEARELSKEAIGLLHQTRATRVLGDCREMESGPSLAAVYWLVHDYASFGANGLARLALVQPTKPQASEITDFYAMVCSNQRYQTELFPSLEAAEAWLGQPTPAEARA